MEDRKLLRKLQRDDIRALDAIVCKYTSYIYAIVQNILRDQLSREDTEETVSDVFLSLWNHRDTEKITSVRAYLAAIARNKAIDKLRTRKLTVPLDDDVLQLSEGMAGVEEALLQKELIHAVRDAVEQLPPQEQEIFRRYYYFYQRTGEIARDMGLNESTVRTRLQRGRAKLRSSLAERGYCDE